MKRFLITLLVLAAIIVGIGFYLHIIKVDNNKLKEEEQKLHEAIQKAPGEINKDVKDATGK